MLNSEDLAPEQLPGSLVRRNQQAAVQMMGPIRAAIEAGGVCTGLLADQGAGQMIPGHQLVVHQVMHMPGSQGPVFVRGTAVVGDKADFGQVREDLWLPVFRQVSGRGHADHLVEFDRSGHGKPALDSASWPADSVAYTESADPVVETRAGFCGASGAVRYPELGSIISKELGKADNELPNYVSISPFRFSNAGAVLLATGILGATVMPHVIFLHSALMQGRIVAHYRRRAVRPRQEP